MLSPKMSALWIAFACLVSLVGGVEPAQAQRGELDPSIRVPVGVDGAPSTGAQEPLVTIVEFSDFYCPHCRAANETLATLLRIYPNQLRVVYRHSLLDGTNATLAAETALAARKRGKFWPMHDRLFAGPAPTSIDGLVALAAEVGLDPEQVRSELTERIHRDELVSDMALAKQLNLRGVPVFFVNGRPLSGAHGAAVFVRIIEEELVIAADLLAKGTASNELYSALLASPTKELAGAEKVFRRGIEQLATKQIGLSRTANRKGGSEPLVTIVEWSDYTCGYCRKTHPIMNEVLDIYGEDLQIVYRHFPLGNLMKPVAEAAEEAGAQGKFWEFTDRIFSDAGAKHASREQLVSHATAVGLDIDQFTRALDEHSHAKTVAEDALEAAALGVTGTPTLFINGRGVVGAPPPEALKALIEEEIAAARALIAEGVPRGEIYEKLSTRDRP